MVSSLEESDVLFTTARAVSSPLVVVGVAADWEPSTEPPLMTILRSSSSFCPAFFCSSLTSLRHLVSACPSSHPSTCSPTAFPSKLCSTYSSLTTTPFALAFFDSSLPISTVDGACLLSLLMVQMQAAWLLDE
jgi:hypothetical protein